MYGVELAESAARFLKQCDKVVSVRITEKIKILETNSIPSNVLRLKEKSSWRMRVGDYRVIYEIRHDAKKILVTKIGHRSNVYDGLE